jgi:tetrahydromethanopterin S-methyltransferase subunit G
MSLVNSIINQVGREIGRDIYRNGFKPKQITTTSNHSLLSEVKNFQLSAYDKTTIRRLANLIEKSESISNRDYQYDEVFITIDEKIDFVKENVDPKHLPELERLDKLNHTNYLVSSSAHKIWVDRNIKTIEDNLNQTKVPKINFKSLFIRGWQIFWFLLLSLMLYNLHTKNIPNDVGVFWSSVIGIFLLFSILIRRNNIKEEITQRNNLENYLSKLKEYKEKL